MEYLMSYGRASRFKHGLILTGVVFCIACFCTISASTRAQENTEQDSGLAGLLPETPFDLAEDEFLKLGDTWSDWSVGVATEVSKLYEEAQDTTSQRASLKVLKTKLDTMDKALADRRYRSIFDPLMTMRSRLGRRVAVAEAALDTLEQNPTVAHEAYLKRTRTDVAAKSKALKNWLTTIQGGKAWIGYMKLNELSGPNAAADVLGEMENRIAKAGKLKDKSQREFMQKAHFVALGKSLKHQIVATQTAAPTYDKAKLRASLGSLLKSLEAYEEDPISKNTVAIRTALATTKKQAPDSGDRIGSAVEENYMNFNVRVVASEKFLNKMVAYQHTDNSPVDDVILGAKVDGTQNTVATVGIDLRPSDDTIRFLMTLDGVTQSRTQGVTDQATIFTSGYHTFKVTKNVSFDGDIFTTKPAGISVNANNTTTGARTKFSGVPLFGGFTNSYAVREARKRKRESQAIASQKLSAKVLPEFNEQVDSEFKKHSNGLQKTLIPKLHDADLYPANRSFQSTHNELWSNTLLMGDGEIGGDAPTFTTSSSKGAVIHLHQSAINNGLARMSLAGQTMTEAQLSVEIGNALSFLLGKDVNIKPEGEPDPTKFVFPKTDVLRIKISDGQLALSLRAGLKTEDDDIPTQVITIPLMFEIKGTDIVVSAGKVSVAPVDPPKSRVRQKVQAGVVEAKVQKALPTRTANRIINVKRPQGAPVKLAISQIKPMAGWLSIVIE
jgi:hypothetical protein